MRALPLSGKTCAELRSQCVFWYVRPLALAALSLDPEARSAIFTVARFRDEHDDRERLEHRFVLSTDPLARWPHSASAAFNALLQDERGESLLRDARESLYGPDARDGVDIGAYDGALLAWGAFAKPDRRPTDRLATAFSPVYTLRRREAREGEYVPGPFATELTFVGEVWDYDRLDGLLVQREASPPAALPPGMGEGELARLASSVRRGWPVNPWNDALRDELARVIALAERLAQRPLTEDERANLRGQGVAQALLSAEWVLRDR